MILFAYIVLVGYSCLVGLSYWRKAVYLAILIDFLRDPVRKLVPGEPVWITVSALLVWAFIFVGLCQRDWGRLRTALRAFPNLRRSLQLAVVAVIPGAIIAIISYNSGYKLAALGAVSYLAPFAGIAIGVLYARRVDDIYRLLGFYILVNSFGMIGSFAEYNRIPIPALGGLQGFTHLRSHRTSQILMVSGFYRGPDITALHAAHVVMFSILLMFRRWGTTTFWGGTALLGMVSLFLAGRRKMLIMPLVFLAGYILSAGSRGTRMLYRVVLPLLLAGICGYLLTTNRGEEMVSSEYVDFASTIMSDGMNRVEKSVYGSTLETIQQTGLFGSGLGSATQGGRYTAVATRNWQEDGTSRAFAELGMVGVGLLLISALEMYRVCVISRQKTVRDFELSTLHALLLSICLADLASFIVSHQHFSGDPSSGVLVLMLLGMAISLPSHLQELDDQQGHTLPT